MADSSHWGSGTHRPGWEKSVCQHAHLFKVKKMQMPVTESLSWLTHGNTALKGASTHKCPWNPPWSPDRDRQL